MNPRETGRLEKPVTHFRSARELAELLDDFTLAWEAVHLMLREKDFTVDDHIENPAAQPCEDRFDVEIPVDLSRQTGGSGQVVSDAAVSDLDLQLDLT